MIMIPQSLKILRMKQMSIILIIVLLFSCTSKKATPKEGDGWLKGDNDRKFETISKHFRGFDMAMMEVGYRYTELYWAGQDQNWATHSSNASILQTDPLHRDQSTRSWSTYVREQTGLVQEYSDGL